jgi:hypothetical protein
MTRSDGVKAYLFTTGVLFGLIAVAHFVRTFAEWSRLGTDPWFYLFGPGLGFVAASLSLWAWLLFWTTGRS